MKNIQQTKNSDPHPHKTHYRSLNFQSKTVSYPCTLLKCITSNNRSTCGTNRGSRGTTSISQSTLHTADSEARPRARSKSDKNQW